MISIFFSKKSKQNFRKSSGEFLTASGHWAQVAKSSGLQPGAALLSEEAIFSRRRVPLSLTEGRGQTHFSSSTFLPWTRLV